MPYDTIISFLLCSVSLSYLFRNYYIFIVCLLLYAMFPSNFFTLDSAVPYASVETISGAVSFINSVAWIVLIGIPSSMIGIIVLQAVTLQFDKIIETLVKTILVIVIEVIVTVVFNKVGIYFFNFDKQIFDNWNKLIGVVQNPQQLLTGFLDSTSSVKSLSFSAFMVMPIFLAMILTVIGIFLNNSDEKKTQKIFNLIAMKDIQRFKMTGLDRSSISVMIFLVSILTCALLLSLSYSVEDMLLYQNQLYFGIYIVIISVCCILMILGLSRYTKNNRNTVMGVLLGFAGLFLFFQVLKPQSDTLSLLSLENQSNITINKIFSQFLFVAPTESLLFHVFLPSLVILLFSIYNRRYDRKEIISNIENLKLQRLKYTLESDIFENRNDKSNYQKSNTKVYEVEKLIKKEQEKLDKSKIDTSDDLTNTQVILFFLFTIVINMLFSFAHFFNSQLEISVFFNSGLFIMYLSAGTWLSFLSYRFGWLTGIIVHALNNSVPLILILIAGGV